MLSFENATIGVNTDNVNSYLTKIRTDVIEEARKTLDSAQDELFTSFRDNWKGQAEVNFEENMKIATEKVKASLLAHYNALEAKIYAINNAWVQQDAGMVERKND